MEVQVQSHTARKNGRITYGISFEKTYPIQ